MTIPVLDHAGLTCADIEKALSFYVELLGLSVLDRGDGVGRAAGIPGATLRFAYLEAGGSRRLELLEYTNPRASGSAPDVNQPGATHLAMVVDDLDGVLERLGQEGVEPLTAPFAPDGGRRLVYVRDPDGRVVELIQSSPGAAR